ncbi:TPA: hypothetical protein ACGO7B_002104 [Streptococcus suis]|uniref:hypothetical protein n=1 Tax=Streptococcus suis TaxID=1307 RepID=UPI0003F5CFB5|nr:hypothetical protein [Streptococcus suis]NQH21226.1 hypothetical protein [Streptococcus suis]CYU68289.1 Domain of uncharacterised function (DUF1994) [Streptococcus suis]HEL1600560.1 hypothetical protein [Streptococcus suis]HEL9646611.1 hypothetical protein [Streptococcus suis]HEM2799825.1 hypothetical protein [Streptococcus suis]
MSKENAILNKEEQMSEHLIESFDFDELEEKLQSQLEEEFSNLEFLKEEKEKIGSPDALGKVILDEVWKQFGNQVGLDLTNETLIQKYEREHQGETYVDVGQKVMQDPKYKKANKAMREQQKSGSLKDEYTGKKIKRNDKANLDHVVARKELYENPRRKQAGINTEDLANKDENLKPTNESLNKSKGAKSVDGYISDREKREKKLKEQNEINNRKIDGSNMSELEKREAKEKNSKRLQDKLDADDELMKNADKKARKTINKDITKGVVKETAKKAGKDALKQMAVSALFSLLKEVMNGFVRFLKNQEKSFKNFLEEMKQAIKSFFEKIMDVLQAGVSSAVGTIVTEIFGPIVSTFQRMASLIKQGVSSIMEAIRYLNNKENKNKPFSIKIAQVGKIIISGLVVGGTIFLGELFEKLLLSVPGMQTVLPMLGTLANIIGMFLASLVSGLVGAIIINLIDKFIAKKQKSAAQAAIMEKGNQIIGKQHQIQIVNEVMLDRDKENAQSLMAIRHQEAALIMNDAYGNIMEDFINDFSKNEYEPTIDEEDVIIINESNKSSDDLDDILNALK